jgi:hypothetical protein
MSIVRDSLEDFCVSVARRLESRDESVEKQAEKSDIGSTPWWMEESHVFACVTQTSICFLHSYYISQDLGDKF